MANTKTDDYLNSLEIWSTFEIDWIDYKIKSYDQANVWTECGEVFSWSEIWEDYELMQLEKKVDDEVDLAINQEKDV